jgi:hypothetical protein
MAFMHRSLQKFMMSHRAGARARQRAGVGDEFRRTPATVAPHTAAGRATFATIFAENRLK